MTTIEPHGEVAVAVILPVYNAGATLRKTLQALLAGQRLPDELVVVDDGSQDGSAEVATSMGAKVLLMPSNLGPSASRDAGVLETSAEILVFLDADVRVHRETLAKLVKHFVEDTERDAVFGAYDDEPADEGVCSQCRNLAHSYVHRSSKREALTFWTGCGGVRRAAFFDAGGFDERHRRPSGEDIEFGYRLSDRGYRILLDPEITVTHLKRWTLVNSILTDLLHRGVPWTVMLLDRRSMPNDLNLSTSYRLSSVAVALSLAFVVIGARFPVWMVAAAVFALAALLPHGGLFRFIQRRRGATYVAPTMGLFLLQQVCGILGLMGGVMVWAMRSRKSVRRSRIG